MKGVGIKCGLLVNSSTFPVYLGAASDACQVFQLSDLGHVHIAYIEQTNGYPLRR
jgi:hypothetical protein